MNTSWVFRKTNILFFVLLLQLLIVGSVFSATITIPTDYLSIQLGINAASNYDTVLVEPGTYGGFNYRGKLLVVKSIEGPLRTRIQDYNVNTNLVIFSQNENVNAVLEGFTLDGGLIAILCQNASPTIRGNIIMNQRITNWGAISLGGDGYATVGNSPAVIVNNTIVNCANGAISTFSSSPPIIKNNIIAYNGNYAIHRHGISSVAQPLLSYNCVYGNLVDYQQINNPGTGTISDFPNLYFDNSLAPGSPCIDAGDPHPNYNDTNGTRNDMGAISFTGDTTSRDPMILRVPSEYLTIQDALNSAINYDTVLIASGTYNETIQIFNDPIIMMSEDGAESTIIRSNATANSFKLPTQLDTVSTETYLNSPDSSMYSDQTGNYFQTMANLNHNTPVIRIINSVSEEMLISGITIDGNNVSTGVLGVGISLTVEDCIIKNCLGSYDGGGMRFQYCAPKILNNKFINNHTPISGAAIFIRLGDGFGTPEIIGNTFYDNVSGNGPAISLIEGDSALVSFNVAYNNITTAGSQRRGAIYVRGKDLIISNNTCDNNTVGCSVLDTKDCIVTNNIFSNNLSAGFDVVVDYGLNEDLIYDYNNVWNNQGSDYENSTPAVHDISENPLYCDPAIGDYTVSSTSICLPLNNSFNEHFGAADAGCDLICGDANADLTVDLQDIIYLITYHFECGANPENIKNADLNCTGEIDLGDIIYLGKLINLGIIDPCCY